MNTKLSNKAMDCIFVAEVSSNHNRDLQRCLKFVEIAAEIGCGAIKFQLFRIEKLFAPEILKNSSLHRNRRNWELPLSFLPEIHKHCLKFGIQFSCTPFYLDAVRELQPYVSFYKIASYEVLWKELLIRCAMTKKPVVLSTGMATIDEINDAVITLQDAGCSDLTLLHCVSAYPTSPGHCNLSLINTLRTRFKCNVGWSDHSRSPAVIYRAVHRWHASMIEFHLDIDGKGDEFHFGHCWLPEQIKPVIQEIKMGFIADGSSEKEISEEEAKDRIWRADPEDGLRPLREMRKFFINN